MDQARRWAGIALLAVGLAAAGETLLAQSDPRASSTARQPAIGELATRFAAEPRAASQAVVWRPGGGFWYAKRADDTVLFRELQWGAAGDLPLLGDFDGDGADDAAVWRPPGGHWYAKRADGSVVFRELQWGAAGDVPLVGDFDGDGRDDVAVWRPSSGQWYARRADGAVIFRELQWGAAGDVPLVGDFDGDGADDVAVWRPAGGHWYARRADGAVIFRQLQWGAAGDVPLVGDFDGDGTSDVAVWRPLVGHWFARRADGTVIFRELQWGAEGDFPLAGDFDGDGRDDLAVWRPPSGHWYAKDANGNVIFRDLQWGAAGDIPLVGHFGGPEAASRPSPLSPDDLALVALAERRPVLGAWNMVSDNPEFPAQFLQDVFLNWNRDDLVWRFRWSRQTAGAARAVWQVTSFEPPGGHAKWRQPPGLVAAGELTSVPAAGVSQEFRIDHRFAPRPQPADALAVHTYFVRVVALDAGGDPIGPASNSVKVQYGTPPPQETTFFDHVDPPPRPKYKTEVTILGYEPVNWKAPDARHRWVVTRDILGADGKCYRCVGQKLFLSSKKEEKDIWDHLTGAISDLGELMVDAVDWVSTAYDDIKTTAVDAAAAAVPGCNSTCRSLVSVGLDYGLTSIGLPPSLPDFDRLTRMGKGYLIETVTDQMGLSEYPFTEEAAEMLVDELYEQAREVANHGSVGGGGWMRPDPDFQFRPAYARVRIRNTTERPVAGRLLISSSAKRGGGWKRLFSDRSVAVPPLKPGEAIVVPVFLDKEINSFLKTTGTSVTEARGEWYDWYHSAELSLLANFYVGHVLEGPAHLQHRPDQAYPIPLKDFVR